MKPDSCKDQIRFRGRLLTSYILRAGFVFVLLVPNPSSLGQEKKTPPQILRFPSAQSRVEVRLGQIEVFVYDEKGNPVPGLKPDDFILTVDGREVPVKYVDEIVTEAPTRQPPELGIKPKAAKGRIITPYRPSGAVPPVTPFNTFIILYDQSHTGGLTFRTIKSQLYRFLNRLMRVNTRFMLVTLDPNGDFKVLNSLTPSLSDILENLDHLSAGTRGASYLVDRLTLIDRSMEGITTCGTVDIPTARATCIRTVLRRVSRQVLSLAQEERRISLNMLKSFEHVFEFLAHVPGRKSILLISEGFDPSGNVYTDYFSSLVQRYVNDYNIPPQIEVDILRDLRIELQTYQTERRSYEEIVDRANSAHLTIYWINPSTPQSLFGAEADIRPTVSTAGATFDDIQYQMIGIAEDTGGVAWNAPTGFNRLFDQIYKDYSRYYLISFDLGSIPESLKYHKIKVRTRRPGLKVRHRKEYADVPWSQRISRQLAAAIDFSKLYPPKKVMVQFHPLWESLDRLKLHVSIAYPIKDLAPLTTTADRLYDEIHVAWIARDRKGDILDRGYERLPIQIPVDNLGKLEEARAAVQYSKVLDIRPGTRRLYLGILEAGGWETSAVVWEPPNIKKRSCPKVGSVILGSEIRMMNHPVDHFQWTKEGHILYKQYQIRLNAYHVYADTGQFGGFYQILIPRDFDQSSFYIRFRLIREGQGLLNEVPPTTIKLGQQHPPVLTNFFLLPYHNLVPGAYRLQLVAGTSNGECMDTANVTLRVAKSPAS